MIQDIGEGRFHNEYRPGARPEADSRVLFYRGREIFVKQDEGRVSFLTWKEVSGKYPCHEEAAVYLFSIDETGYYLLPEFENEGFSTERLSALFPEYSWEKLELMRTAVPREAAFAGVTGMQLFDWYRTRRFCPACGGKMRPDEKERMMRCPSCGHHEYPKICPAVIVGVTCGNRLLLTKYAGRAFRRYALIAGFAEIGEPIEDTVRREVMEEVGLKVRNLRYYKSQPWSFTDTLLMGFFAEVDGDSRIVLDTTELAEGKWCTPEEVPEDDGLSLTREMMTVFKKGLLWAERQSSGQGTGGMKNEIRGNYIKCETKCDIDHISA